MGGGGGSHRPDFVSGVRSALLVKSLAGSHPGGGGTASLK